MVERKSGWWLACSTCGAAFPVAVYKHGCPECAAADRAGALLVQYDRQAGTLPARDGLGIWANWAQWLPAVEPRHRVTLGEGNTPLLRVAALSELTGCDRLFLKMEPQNPTGAFKDRFHAVNSAVAAHLGMRGVVAASTGNHGLALSAYAAAHGLAAVVVGNPRMPALLQRAIRFTGGLPLLASPEVGDAVVDALVDSGAWLPATMVWPISTTPNPFGIEGYKTIAYEIYRDLGERMPDRIFAPTAGGDLLTGLWRGQNDLQAAGFANARSRLIACQPTGAAPLVAALAQGLDHVPALPHTDTIALSIGDPCTGKLALDAVRGTGGDALAVDDADILETGRLLARAGVLAEPSSAASVAVARNAIAQNPALRDETIVCVITSSALKWLDDYGTSTAASGLSTPTAAAGLGAVEDYLADRR
jgi:threonine synthase